MPAGDGPVIVDTTPVIALALVGHLGLLRSLYDRVVVPPAVRAELRAGRSHHAGSVELKAAPWIETVALADPSRADLLSDLDRGEAEVIALGQETRSKLVIIDERLGRLHARRLGLPLTGTIGILLRAKENDLLPAVRPILQRLRDGGIYLGAGLVEQALRLAGE
jgi:predicted nucleic acid-binding protein